MLKLFTLEDHINMILRPSECIYPDLRAKLEARELDQGSPYVDKIFAKLAELGFVRPKE